VHITSPKILKHQFIGKVLKFSPITQETKANSRDEKHLIHLAEIFIRGFDGASGLLGLVWG
jgi:hypothetical protein